MPAAFDMPVQAYANGGIMGGPPSFVGEGRGVVAAIGASISHNAERDATLAGAGREQVVRPVVKNYIVNDFNQALREGFVRERDTITGIVNSDPRTQKNLARGR